MLPTRVARSVAVGAAAITAILAATTCGGGDKTTGPSQHTPSVLTKVGGDGQTGPVAQALPGPILVRVTDAAGGAVAGVTVTWSVASGGGSVGASSTTTDASGQTSTTWTLGPVVGSNSVSVGVTGLTAVVFSATSVAGPATRIVLAAGNAQTAPAGTALPLALSVRVADAHGNGVSGVSVSWAVLAGGGLVSAANSLSDAGGLASTQRTLGPSKGVHTTSASVSGLAGSPLVFADTATPNGTISGTITLVSRFLAPRATKAARAPVPGPSLAPPIATAPARTEDRQSMAAAAPLRSSPTEYTPDELIVTYRPDVLRTPRAGSPLLANAAVAEGARIAIQSAIAAHEAPGRLAATGVSPAILAARVKVADPSQIDEVAAELRADPAIATVSRNAIYWSVDAFKPAPSPSSTTPNDPLYPWQAWHYGMIDLPKAWGITTGSASVIVGVVDDGIRFDHPAIAANLTSDGYDFVSWYWISFCDGSTAPNGGDGNGYDPDPTDPVSLDVDPSRGCAVQWSRSGNHGLHVAATIGAVGNDGVGVSGVNWTVRIRPVRVMGMNGSGVSYDIAQGILYAAGLPADNGAGGTVQAPSAARIVNMSLGSSASDTVAHLAVIAAYNAGALLVAAAGNDGVSAPTYPAAYPEVLSVSSVGPSGELASYSNFGSTIDIAAPGGGKGDSSVTFGVMSAAWNFVSGSPIYDEWDGTSMAAPHVAGVAALLLARSPSLTAAQLRSRLTTYADDVGLPGRDDWYGAGILNARNSLTQTFSPARRLYARLYDATTGALVQTVAAGAGGSYAFTALSDGSYLVYAGADEDADGVIGIPGRPWGAFGGTPVPAVVTVAGAGNYPASFTFGYPTEEEPNNAVAYADVLPVGGYLFGSISNPSTDFDVSRILISQAGQYTIETSGWEGACGFAMEEDTYIALYDSTGTPLASNDDASASALNYCSRITATLTPGTYYVAVAGKLGQRYRLQARAGS